MIYGDKVSGKFNLNYAGKPSLFEGKTSLPEKIDEVKIQVLGADQAGNFGHHSLTFRIAD